MFKTNDYDFLYSTMLNCHKEETTFVYWYRDGEHAKKFYEVNNITLTCPSTEFYVDIFMYKFVILNWGKDIRLTFSTKEFIENNDEEFFQQSTVQDFSAFEEKFIKELIRISLMIREGKHV